MTLAISIICKNSERTIEATLRASRELLDRFPDAGPIVAFDSGSTDSTLSLLEKYGATIVHCEWKGYVGTKQAALSHTERLLEGQGWILCLDSDESPDVIQINAIEDLIRRDRKDVHAAKVNRRVEVWGKLLKRTWQPEWRLRLVRTGHAYWGGRDPHDELKLSTQGRVIKLPGMLLHDTMTSFTDVLWKPHHYGRIAGENAFRQGARTSGTRLVFGPVFAFLKQYVLKRGFIDGYAGLIVAASSAAYTLLKHIVWLELQLGRSQHAKKTDQ